MGTLSVDGRAGPGAAAGGHAVSAGLLPVRIPRRVAGSGSVRVLPRGPALGRPEHPSSAVVALRYAHPVDEMIRRLKYHGVVAMRACSACCWPKPSRQRGAPLPRLLVPVPLHAARLRERGFNQAAALARYAGRMLEVPMRTARDDAASAIRRRRHRSAWMSAHRNVRGAFAVSGARAWRRLLAAGHVAIVDDVMTTGSTLREARARVARGGCQAGGPVGGGAGAVRPSGRVRPSSALRAAGRRICRSDTLPA